MYTIFGTVQFYLSKLYLEAFKFSQLVLFIIDRFHNEKLIELR